MGNVLSAKLLRLRDRDLKLRGGAFVKKGGFGCTYSPPVLSRDPAMLGKIIEGEELAVKEYNSYEKVKRVDPSGDYGVYAQSLERIDVGRNHEDVIDSAGGKDNVDKCPALQTAVYRELIPIWQITMPKAAGDVLDVLLPFASKPCHLSILVFHMIRLRNLYTGLVYMHKANICHLDIKDINAVIFGTAEEPKSYKYIDFGLSKTFDELASYSSQSKPHHLVWNYFSYPILTNLIWAAKNGEWVDYFSPAVEPGLQAMYAKNPFLLAQESRHPRLKVTFASLKQDNQNLIKTYECQNLQEKRVAAARATDVFGLAQLTASVFRLLAHYVFEEQDESFQFTAKQTNKFALETLLPTANLLGALLSDMMHMRIKDSEVLVQRYDAVVTSAAKLLPDVVFQTVLNHMKLKPASALDAAVKTGAEIQERVDAARSIRERHNAFMERFECKKRKAESQPDYQ